MDGEKMGEYKELDMGEFVESVRPSISMILALGSSI